MVCSQKINKNLTRARAKRVQISRKTHLNYEHVLKLIYKVYIISKSHFLQIIKIFHNFKPIFVVKIMIAGEVGLLLQSSYNPGVIDSHNHEIEEIEVI